MEQGNTGEKSVLVVEDEPGIAIVCLRILNAEGFRVDIAINGEIALDMWKEKKYDLCISDIRTPYMNGIEFFKRLTDQYPEAIKKFIFTTGDVMSGNVKEFLEETGKPYLPKPFTPEELRAIVRKTMVVV
jgi:CheY-like chemotaxis protein